MLAKLTNRQHKSRQLVLEFKNKPEINKEAGLGIAKKKFTVHKIVCQAFKKVRDKKMSKNSNDCWVSECFSLGFKAVEEVKVKLAKTIQILDKSVNC
jgi:hypothetical protein